ncbi:FtsX-like permease family protein [Sedimentibacter sp. zth1]|uniref:FtsX-like permease family protein n=1 Tax=Sedimentibacter sp. zth1 TaxID=2816908 RepID=UPI001A935A3F|nr:FtsX-like permease family protein [Sedimentibacter sp. zth1]QSX05037.1 FtsX-like permease family protein [Sedimentibacter sp. zth1]
MNRMFYTKLAFTNIKNNKKTYIPYILTCICTIMMYYMMHALSVDESLSSMYGGRTIHSYLFIGNIIIGIFATIFLFYTNNFLIRNRKKEFGLFNILGMEKKHISIILLLETLIITIFSLIIGIIAGILFSKLALLLLLKILNFDVKFGFSLSIKSIISTTILFVFIFGLSFLNNLRQIHLSNPVELLSGAKQGEKEPKTKIVLSLVGLVSLGAGYYIAIVTKNPVSAMALFFIAVVLVIIGTYCLFTAGSILFLKILKRNKNYYYKTKHFISVSGMIYRMKQNAVGLSNICILSTMVLVTVSSTVSLFVGMDDILVTRYPNDIIITSNLSDDENGNLIKDDNYINGLSKVVDDVLAKYNNKQIDKVNYKYFSITTLQNNENFDVLLDLHSFNANVQDFYLITLEDYNRLFNATTQLNDGEALIYSNRNEIEYDEITLLGEKIKIVGKMKDKLINPNSSMNIISSHILVVKDESVVDKYYDKVSKISKENNNDPTLKKYFIGIDLDTEKGKKIEIFKDVKENLRMDYANSWVECRANEEQEFCSVYGGIFFLGIFLGILFIMATVLIMYYKQISEGFDDKARFNIMQQVGMSKKEVKSSIHSQVITVFFLPLIVSGIHTTLAFPMISRILALLNLTNTSLFVMCTVATYLIFGLFYILVYGMTAKTYYKIVE